jgi:enamine deaminase RidA (YjgF/YER057c/UK114 family)
MENIQYNSVGPRMSGSVLYNGILFLAGQVANPAEDGDDVAKQTATVLRKIDALLKEAGTSKENVLKAEVWLAQIKDFDAMNSVYDKWVVPGRTPARCCGESRLVKPEYLVEIMITAAVPPSAPTL